MEFEPTSRTDPMAIERYYVRKENWGNILSELLKKFSILAPMHEHGGLFLKSVTSENSSSIIYDQARAAQPLKVFFLPPLEEVVGEPIKFDKPLMFLGIKACDLKALSIIDQAFGGEFTDFSYQTKRSQSMIVSSDCTTPWETCFCTLLGDQPYLKSGFDLNLSEFQNNFIIEVGSQKGKDILIEYPSFLKTFTKLNQKALSELRKNTTQVVQKQNRKYKVSKSQKELVSKNWESDVWRVHSDTCVECGACTHACPTCHCYSLDDVTRSSYVKLRGWDSCQYTGYAVTAGGGNPRPRLYNRFRNRYFCKFKYLDDNFGQYGCTGCGRCIEGCQGKIDMRAAIRDLE